MRRPPVISLISLGFCALTVTTAGAQDVAVSTAQVERMDIKLSVVRPTNRETVALLPGTVVPALNSRVVAATPFGGTVVQVHVVPGQSVTKGMPLVTISSRELLDAISQLAQAEAELQMADALARRKRTLVEKNFQNATVAEEAEAQVAKIKAVMEQHKRAISLGGITLGESGQFTIPALAEGRIVETLAVPGGKLDVMAAAVTIDTSNELWIEAQVPLDLVSRIRPGDPVQVLDGPESKVVSIGGSLDRMTRSALMLVTVPVDSGLISGQMVTLSVMRQAETGSLAVPYQAVSRINDHYGVFVRNNSGFTLVPVTLRGRSPSGATIAGDVAPDAQVATSGLPQLEQMLTAQ